LPRAPAAALVTGPRGGPPCRYAFPPGRRDSRSTARG